MEGTKKKLRTISTAGIILSLLFILALAMLLIGCLIIMVLAQDIEMSLVGIAVTGEITAADIRMMAAVLIVDIVSMLLVFILLYKIFQNIRSSSPFNDANVRNMRWIALVLLATGILSPILNIVANHFMEGAEIPLGTGMEVIIGAAIFYCLSLIFQYGTELQKESDQTL